MNFKKNILRLRQDIAAQVAFFTKDGKTGTDKRVDDLIRMAYCRGAIDTLHNALKEIDAVISCYTSDQIAVETLYNYYGNYLSRQAEADPNEPDAWTRGQNTAVNMLVDKLESLFSQIQLERSVNSQFRAYIN